MKEIAVTIGWKVLDDNNNVIGYKCDKTDNGYCYKDMNAFEDCDNITPIYISEGYFEDSDIISVEDVKDWYFQDWVDWVKGIINHHNFESVNELTDDLKYRLMVYLCGNVLDICDWQDLSTYLEEWDWEDCIDDIIQDISK